MPVTATPACGAAEGEARAQDLWLFPRQVTPGTSTRSTRRAKIELELVPQGTLAERSERSGRRHRRLLHADSFGTRLAEGKETRRIGERDYVLGYPLHADYALIKAQRADRWGNLVYRKSARNFGPIMAAAAKCTVVQVAETAELGVSSTLEAVVTPGIFVKRIVRVAAPARKAA